MLDIKVNNGKMVVGEKAMQELKTLHDFQITLQEMKNEENAIKEAMMKAMADNGIKSYENDFIKISYLPESERKTVDTEEMKKEGVYDMYSKTVKVKPQVRITYLDEH
jgi:hypothetical protein